MFWHILACSGTDKHSTLATMGFDAGFSLLTPMLFIKSMSEGESEIIGLSMVELVQDATKICLDSLVRLPLEARPALISAESLDQLMSAP